MTARVRRTRGSERLEVTRGGVEADEEREEVNPMMLHPEWAARTNLAAKPTDVQQSLSGPACRATISDRETQETEGRHMTGDHDDDRERVDSITRALLMRIRGTERSAAEDDLVRKMSETVWKKYRFRAVRRAGWYCVKESRRRCNLEELVEYAYLDMQIVVLVRSREKGPAWLDEHRTSSFETVCWQLWDDQIKALVRDLDPLELPEVVYEGTWFGSFDLSQAAMSLLALEQVRLGGVLADLLDTLMTRVKHGRLAWPQTGVEQETIMKHIEASAAQYKDRKHRLREELKRREHIHEQEEVRVVAKGHGQEAVVRITLADFCRGEDLYAGEGE